MNESEILETIQTQIELIDSMKKKLCKMYSPYIGSALYNIDQARSSLRYAELRLQWMIEDKNDNLI